MANRAQHRDLQLDEDLRFQRRNWRIERIAWAVLASIIVAAALGLFGNGPVGSRKVTTADGTLSLEYQRFWRLQSPMTLNVEVRPATAESTRATIYLTRSYIDAMDISRITPQPERVEAQAVELAYVFALAEPGLPFTATFRVEPARPWTISGTVRTEGGGESTFTHFIYP